MLIADDDQVFATTLGDILRLRGYEPVPVASGREAVESASMHPPVAIVDLHLPDMSGMDVVSALHTVSETTSVIVLTGNGTLETAIAALREESFDYLLKPVDVDVLLNVVSVGVERWRMRTFQAQLRQSEARYRELFDRNPQPLWVFDLETLRFVALNDSATRQYGYSREELLSMTVEQIRPAEDVAAFRQDVFAPAREEGKRWRHRRKDGTIIDVEVIANDFMFAGRPSRLALIIDVTSRLRQERAQRARAQQQAAVAEFGQDALALRDVDGLMQRASDVVARTLEVPLVALFERHPGRQQLQMRAGSGWDAALATFLMDDVTSLDAPVLAEHGVVSGHTVEIPGPASPLGVLGAYDRVAREFSSNDTHFLQAMAHIVGGAVSRIASERALRQSQRLEAVGRVAGGVAHDFNNIVTAITGFTELVKAELRPGDAALDDVQEILNATQRARALTGQLLAFSRQQVLQPRLLDINSIVLDMEKMLRHLVGPRIHVITDLDPALGAVMADHAQIEQVLLNLSVNARDAMPDGGELRIATRNAEDRPVVTLTISDTGMGMDEETRLRIFEPFFTTKGDRGTGLGLSTVYGIVKQSGGDIAVTTGLGAGTTFRICLPHAR